MKRLIVLAALILAACDGSMGGSFSDAQRDEIGDIAGDAVSDDETIQELTSRVDELEDRLTNAESDLADAQAELAEVESRMAY